MVSRVPLVPRTCPRCVGDHALEPNILQLHLEAFANGGVGVDQDPGM